MKGSDLKSCACAACRRGLHTRGGGAAVRYRRQAARRALRAELNAFRARYICPNDDDLALPARVVVGYTD